MKARPHGANRNVENLGNLLIAELLYFPEYQGRFQVGRHLIQDALNEDSVLNRTSLMVLDGVDLAWFRPFQPKTIHTKANADSIEKPRKRTVISQAMELSEGLEKRLLRDVLGFMTIAKQVRRRADKSTPMAVDEHRQGTVVPTAASGNPSQFLGRIESHRGIQVRFNHRPYALPACMIARRSGKSKAFALTFLRVRFE